MPVFHEVEVGEEDFCWALPVEGLAGSGVERPCDGVEVVLGVATEVVSLGEILAQQAVGVFVDAALPWAVWVGEVDLDARLLGQFPMAGHFFSPVIGHGEPVLRVDPGQNAGEAFHGGLGACAVHPGQGHEEGLALHQSADGGTVVSALDGVALPVARDKALLDLGGAVVDADGVGDLSSAVFAAGAGTALAATEAQQGDDLRAQLAARHGVDGLIDRLVGEVQVLVLRVHALERTCCLFG